MIARASATDTQSAWSRSLGTRQRFGTPVVFRRVEVEENVLGLAPAAYRMQRNAPDGNGLEQIHQPVAAPREAILNLWEARNRIKRAQGFDSTAPATFRHNHAVVACVRHESAKQARGKEGGVAGHTQGAALPLLERPAERGMNAAQWPSTWHGVRSGGEIQLGEPFGATGNQAGFQSRVAHGIPHSLDHRPSTNLDQRLWASEPAARSAGEDRADSERARHREHNLRPGAVAYGSRSSSGGGIMPRYDSYFNRGSWRSFAGPGSGGRYDRDFGPEPRRSPYDRQFRQERDPGYRFRYRSPPGGYDRDFGRGARGPFMPDDSYRRHPEYMRPPLHRSGRWPAAGHDLVDDDNDWSDEEIRGAVLATMEEDSWIISDQIGVTVEDGVVTLEGEVGDYMEARYAWDDAWETEGVRGVINHLTVRTEAAST